MHTTLVFALLAACAFARSEESATTEEYDATIVFVKFRSEFQGSAYVLDRDSRYVVRLKKKDGTESTYLIHSPTIKLHVVAENSAGQTIRVRETIKKLANGDTQRELTRVESDIKPSDLM